MEKDTSEIAKLAERIAKDPKSKLFVPLAEEYKKAGDIGMAVQVLTEGLKNNPSYVTARSFLGRLLMEQGDLAGAQKELEEVIKAIPDNLLAQRKLGDIYVLQGRAADAVTRYKAALALNPADKEIPSLLADIDAGKDISARIPRPKSAAPVAPKIDAPAVPAAPQAAVKAPVTPPQPQAKPSPATQAPGTPAQPKVPAAAAAASAVPSAPPTEAKAPVPQPQPQAKPSPSMPSPVAAPPPAATPSPAADDAEIIEEIVDIEAFEAPAAAAPVRNVEAAPVPEAMAFDLTEAPVEAALDPDDAAAAVWTPQEPVAEMASAPAPAAEEGGDDLNTNTLAELYISQGFYDKALEIYQGMLNDQPANRALQQKIGQLKELAGAQEPAAVQATPVMTEAREYTPPPAEVAAEPAQKASPAPVAADAAPQAPERTQTAMETTAAAPVAAGILTASARRKVTIDRLESWLKNVAKEKP